MEILVDAMAMGRNVVRWVPFRIVKEMQLDCEMQSLQTAAEFCWALGRGGVGQINDAMERLPKDVVPGMAVCMDVAFHQMQFVRRQARWWGWRRG